MSGIRDRSNRFKREPLKVVGTILLLALAVILLFSNGLNSNQSTSPSLPLVRFEGEYNIAGGEWNQIEAGVHIPATKGEVTLRGSFELYSPNGEHIGPVEAGAPIAFFMDHISVTICESGCEPYVMDNENPIIGPSACGESWVSHSFSQNGDTPIEIQIRNPHRYGNEVAIDEFIENLQLWLDIDFERSILESGNYHRNAGLLFIIIAFVFLGSALFSALLGFKTDNMLWLLGLATLCAGLYFIYDAPGIFFWDGLIVSNTTIVGISMMLYTFFVCSIISHVLLRTRVVAAVLTTLLGAADAVFLLLPTVSDIFFYDLLPFWVIVQTAVNLSLIVCIVVEAVSQRTRLALAHVGSVLPLSAFIIDAFMTYLGAWKGGVVSKHIFVFFLIASLVALFRIIPYNINAVLKARELEAQKNALYAELAESRISTMISQIRPHFIYNTLGSIEQLCELDPPKAGELVHNFSKYLRGNFGELDNPRPIPMSKELEHVKYYISIENVRFPDMTFTFEMDSVDFCLPALTIQPIVENAIKHGLMKLQKGGRIRVASFETESDYCVSVEDNGVGFDTSILSNKRQHVGIRNIRGRLEAMVGGTLEIESEPGRGTRVLIKIPKEVKDDRNSR